jgi:hypothetical protein
MALVGMLLSKLGHLVLMLADLWFFAVVLERLQRAEASALCLQIQVSAAAVAM